MPFRNTSVMGGSQGWQYDDQEKAAIDAKNRYGDQAARMYLAQMQSNDNRYNTDAQTGANRYSTDAQVAISGRQEDRAAQELNRFGSFDDNFDKDWAMGNLKLESEEIQAKYQYGANNKLADLETSRYNDGADVRKAEGLARINAVGLQSKRDGTQGRFIDMVDREVAASLGKGGSVFSPDDMRAMGRSAMKMPEDTSKRDSIADSITFLRKRADEDPNPNNEAAYVQAMQETRKTGSLPANLPKRAARPMASNEDLATRLGSQADGFAQRDAATFGWDPTMEDVELVAGLRDRLAKQLIEQNGIDPEQAFQEATALVEEKLAPQASSAGTGWIQTLRQRLGSVR